MKTLKNGSKYDRNTSNNGGYGCYQADFTSDPESLKPTCVHQKWSSGCTQIKRMFTVKMLTGHNLSSLFGIDDDEL